MGLTIICSKGAGAGDVRFHYHWLGLLCSTNLSCNLVYIDATLAGIFSTYGGLWLAYYCFYLIFRVHSLSLILPMI